MSPSPGSLSGSLLTAETSVNPAEPDPASVTVTATVTPTSR
jgi:hypothetical protein